MELFEVSDVLKTLQIGPQSWWFRGLILKHEVSLMTALQKVLTISPPRKMMTPGGQRMSVLTTCCGKFGWISDRKGYRYETLDPVSALPWPDMPETFRYIAQEAANVAGFRDFEPDTCLINQYSPGAKMGLHQDKDEHDFSQPIVSVSLGLPATFLFGGLRRSDKTYRLLLRHGDVVVWGGVDRLRFHGVLPVVDGHHPLTGNRRINLTLRRVE